MKLVSKDGRLLSKTPGRLLRIHNFYVAGGSSAVGVNRLKKYDSEGNLLFDVFNTNTVQGVNIDQGDYIYAAHGAVFNPAGEAVNLSRFDFETGALLDSYGFVNGSLTGYDVSFDLNRNIYLVGRGDATTYKITKLTPDGTLLWTKATFGNNSALAVSGDRENNVVTSMRVGANIQFQKYTANGDLLWQGPLSFYTVTSLSTDIDSQVYLTRLTTSGLVKFNKDTGTQTWSFSASNQRSVEARRVNSQGEVEVFVCGNISNGDNIRKVSGSGNLIWAARYGNDPLRSVSVDLVGNVIMGSTVHGAPERNIRKLSGADGSEIWSVLTASGQTINSVKAT